MTEQTKIIAWRVEFENGAVEFWPAADIQGTPTFGRWVTALTQLGEVIDNEQEAPDD